MYFKTDRSYKEDEKYLFTDEKAEGVTCVFLLISCYNPEFDSLLTKKVQQAALEAAFGTFLNFLVARYALGFFVCEQIFLIFFIGTICFGTFLR